MIYPAIITSHDLFPSFFTRWPLCKEVLGMMSKFTVKASRLAGGLRWGVATGSHIVKLRDDPSTNKNNSGWEIYILLYIIYNYIYTGWWYTLPTPLKNDGLRQLGWWHSHIWWEVIKVMFQTTNQYNSSMSYSSWDLWTGITLQGS
jgi:hypothetical protein